MSMKKRNTQAYIKEEKVSEERTECILAVSPPPRIPHVVVLRCIVVDPLRMPDHLQKNETSRVVASERGWGWCKKHEHEGERSGCSHGRGAERKGRMPKVSA